MKFGGVGATNFLQRLVRGGVIGVKDDQYPCWHIMDDSVFCPPLALGIEDRQTCGKPRGNLSIQKAFPFHFWNPAEIELGANPVGWDDGAIGPGCGTDGTV